MTITADDFVNRVLSKMPTATPRREQIAMELRGHISERVNAGEPLEEILEHLGDPVALAESYLSAVPLVAGDFWSRATARLIDFGLPVVLLAPVACLIWLATPLEWVPPLLFIYVFVGGATIAIYPMVAEARYGKTLGKHLRGLRVVTESGMTNQHRAGHRAQPALAARGVVDRRAVCAVHRQEPAGVRAAVEDACREVEPRSGLRVNQTEVPCPHRTMGGTRTHSARWDSLRTASDECRQVLAGQRRSRRHQVGRGALRVIPFVSRPHQICRVLPGASTIVVTDVFNRALRCFTYFGPSRGELCRPADRLAVAGVPRSGRGREGPGPGTAAHLERCVQHPLEDGRSRAGVVIAGRARRADLGHDGDRGWQATVCGGAQSGERQDSP